MLEKLRPGGWLPGGRRCIQRRDRDDPLTQRAWAKHVGYLNGVLIRARSMAEEGVKCNTWPCQAGHPGRYTSRTGLSTRSGRRHSVAEMFHCQPQTAMPVDGRLPAQDLPGTRNVGPTDPRIILRQGRVSDSGAAARKLKDLSGKFEDRDFVRVTKVYRFMEIGSQEPHNPLHQVADVAKAARLRPVAVNRQGLAAQSLPHEIGKHAAIVKSHSRSVG